MPCLRIQPTSTRVVVQSPSSIAAHADAPATACSPRNRETPVKLTCPLRAAPMRRLSRIASSKAEASSCCCRLRSEAASEGLVQVRARFAARSQPEGRRAGHDQAAPVRRIELGCAPEMAAGFLEAAGIVRRETFAVLGGGALASLDTDVRLEIGDEVRLGRLRRGACAARYL